MGCDIHTYLEVYDPKIERWVMIDQDPGDSGGRNYSFFNALAGVRGGGPATPKGLPDDMSDSVRYIWDHGWELDGHSMSYHAADEFIALWQKCHGEDIPYYEERIADCESQELDGRMIESLRESRDYCEEVTKEQMETLAEKLLGIWTEDEDILLRLRTQYRVVYWFDN